MKGDFFTLLNLPDASAVGRKARCRHPPTSAAGIHGAGVANSGDSGAAAAKSVPGPALRLPLLFMLRGLGRPQVERLDLENSPHPCLCLRLSMHLFQKFEHDVEAPRQDPASVLAPACMLALKTRSLWYSKP